MIFSLLRFVGFAIENSIPTSDVVRDLPSFNLNKAGYEGKHVHVRDESRRVANDE